MKDNKVNIKTIPVAVYSESCADCAYHHCKSTCATNNSSSCKMDGECLYYGIYKKCFEKRCEHFKSWKGSG